MRRLLSAAVGSLAISLFIYIYPTNAVETFKFSGSGFGHGVGLSQIGAKAMANDGKSAEEILKYYFTGVTIEPVADWYDVRVNIGHQLKSAKIQLVSNTGYLLIKDFKISDQKTIATFNYTNSGISTSIKKGKKLIATLPPTTQIQINWSGTRFLEGDTSVISFSNGKATRYQFGQINLTVVGKSFEVTNNVRIKDEYLYGISEVSSSWPMQSLRAQAIARSEEHTSELQSH